MLVHEHWHAYIFTPTTPSSFEKGPQLFNLVFQKHQGLNLSNSRHRFNPRRRVLSQIKAGKKPHFASINRPFLTYSSASLRQKFFAFNQTNLAVCTPAICFPEYRCNALPNTKEVEGLWEHFAFPFQV